MKRLILLASIGVFLSFVSKTQADEKKMAQSHKNQAAIAVAKNWLKLLNQKKYAKSWDTAASLFKNQVDRNTWQKKMSSAIAPLGKVRNRKLLGSKYSTSLPGAPDGEYVVIIFQTDFANKKAAMETITPMKDKDGKWRVSGYYIK